MDGVEFDAEVLQQGAGQSVGLDQAEEDVLGAYGVVVEHPGLLLSQDEHLPGTSAEVVHRLRSSVEPREHDEAGLPDRSERVWRNAGRRRQTPRDA
ncbi:hypothetical protein GCM10010466_08200 [Planomonospora alba]|uniref:Uncharacterized protein n=1 Tax=Planomonospora alba TaxID=161354 RepID=A0ABP6MML4_9ACTN